MNRVDVQHAVKEVARFMADPKEGAWSMLKRLVRYFVDHGRLVQVISEQRYVKAPHVDTDRLCGLRGHQDEHDVCYLFHGVT